MPPRLIGISRELGTRQIDTQPFGREARSITHAEIDEQSSSGTGPTLAAVRNSLINNDGNVFSELGVNVQEVWQNNNAGLWISNNTRPQDQIRNTIRTALNQGQEPIVIGGDQSIVFPIVAEFHTSRQDFDIVQIDAYPNLRNEFRGSHLRQECAFARVMDFFPGVLYQFGIRATPFIQQPPPAWISQVQSFPMTNWQPGARLPGLAKPVYVAIDLCSLDPAFAPDTIRSEPGGLSTRDLITLIQSVPTTIIGASIVGLVAKTDKPTTTSAVAAKLVKEIAGKMIASGPLPR